MTRVLVVDDDDGIRPMVAEFLRDVGHQVETASNGLRALQALPSAQPQVILLDMRMPLMDGWGFVREYRRLPGPHAPIVVMTAAEDAEKRAREVSADAFLAKPFDITDLLSTVERLSDPGVPA